MKLFTRERDERGAMLVLATAGVVLAMIAAGLAIDLGRLAQDDRDDQRIADLAALDAARVLPGTAAAIQTAATDSATRNGFPATTGYTVTAVEGTKVGGGCQSQSGANKVCVTVTSPFKNVLPFGVSPSTVHRSAVAGQNGAEAEFSVGSSLATLDTQKTVLDSVLSTWLGTSTNLSTKAVSYDGLATGNVTLLALQQNLLAMGYAVGTPTQLMNTNIKVADLLTASSQALGSSSQPTAKAEIDKIIAATVNTSLVVQLGKLINVTTPGSTDALSTSVNVFQLVNGSAQVANGTSFVDVPGLSVTVPLLTSLTAKVKVIEPAQIARGPVGTTAKNSQVTLRLNFNLSVVGVLGLVAVQLDYTNAAAVGTLTQACPTANPASITINAQTSGLTETGSAVLAAGTALTIAGSVGASGGGTHDFTYPTDFASPVGSGSAWRTGVAQLGLGTSVTVTGTGLAGTLAATAVQPVLNLTLPLLDTALNPVLKPVLQALGLELAAADVTAINMFNPPPLCGQAGAPALLQ